MQVSGELEKTMLAEAYQKFVLKSHERITHNIKILHQFRENYREHFLQDNYEELLKIMEELIGFVQQESRRSNVFKLNRRAYSLVKELVPEDIL